MLLEIKRAFLGRDSILGILSVDGKPFCFTVEDELRKEKIAGETCIPEGCYEIKLRNEGGMTKRYGEKFDFHKGMLWLQDVPNFEWVYIHIGNTDKHSEGCILVNYNGMIDTEFGGGTGGFSTQCYTDLYKMIIADMEKGNKVHIVVKNTI